MDGGIEGAQFHLALQLSCGLRPVGCQSLAVATPGGEELNKPHVVTLQNQFVEVRVSQFNNVLLVSRLKQVVSLQHKNFPIQTQVA